MKKAFLLSILIFLSSCSMIMNSYLSGLGIYTDEVEFIKLQKENSEVLLIPNKHLATQTYYKNLRSSVDSLTNIDYFFFYETVLPENLKTKEDTLKYKENLLKFRRIRNKSNYDLIDDGGYIDTLNNRITLNNRNIKLRKKLEYQFKPEFFFKNEADYDIVDVTISEMVDEFESRHGVIELTDCDYETEAKVKYECENEDAKKNGRRLNDIIVDFRNEHVVDEILKGEHSKIAVIYGSAHMEGIQKLLEESGYKQIKN